MVPIRLTVGRHAYVIPPGARHKIVNVGATDVVMIVACAPAWHEEGNVFLE